MQVPKETATSGTGFTFPLPEEVAANATAIAPIRATTIDGKALPAWLRFDSLTRTFVASAVPDGAFPMLAAVTAGNRRVVVMISEKSAN